MSRLTDLCRRRGPPGALMWVLAPVCLALLGVGDATVPQPDQFLQQQLGDAISDIRILEVGTRGVFVYGRVVTDDGAQLAGFCVAAAEALQMVLPGRSAHVLWHTPSGNDYACPAPNARRALPPRPSQGASE
ncbi:MAG: hypothetical protein V3V67_02790 [Myxococcota bacterium]